MSCGFNKGVRSRKILSLLKDKNEFSNGDLNDNITQNVKPGPSGVTRSKLLVSPLKQIVIDKHERVLLERQKSYEICLRDPKSLSLSDLTQDLTHIMFIKRSLSTPAIPDQASEMLKHSINPSILIGLYNDDYECADNDPDYENITTDLGTSEDEYGNLDEGRKRRHIARKEEWKKHKAQKLRMRGEEYLAYTKPRNEKMRQNQMRLAKHMSVHF